MALRLKDRVSPSITGSGFTVSKSGLKGTSIKYMQTMYLVTVSPSTNGNELQNGLYSDAMDTNLNSLMKDRFVTVWEYQNGQVIDEYQFYFNDQGAQKVRIQWNIRENREYGADHYEIVLKWSPEHYSEKISKEHICLKLENKSYNRKFSFLNDQIGPNEENIRERNYVDCYIINIPEQYRSSIRASDLYIEGDELFQQKYELRQNDNL